jgi:hypothetical protein
MDWKGLKYRLTAAHTNTATTGFRLPSLMLELQPDFVVAAKLDGSAHRVRRIGVRGLESGTLDPNPGRANIINQESLHAAVRSAIHAVGNGSGSMGLLVSDGAVRAAVLPFETIPEGHKEFEALARWRMKPNLSYPPEEARLSCQVARGQGTGFEVLALAIKDSVVGEYNAALRETHAAFDLILPVTAALLPLLPSPTGAQLLLNVCCGWMTSVVVSSDRVCFWRTREITHQDAEGVHRAVITEAARVLASTRDHMNLEVAQVWLCVRPSISGEFAREVGRAISQGVEILAPDSALAPELQPQERSIFNDLGAPYGGLLMNGKA